MAKQHVPAVSIAVMKNGKVVKWPSARRCCSSPPRSSRTAM
jgi:hypothetical protein